MLRRYLEECSESAFGELVRRHLNLVYFAALRQVNGDTHCAEDITQGVFAKLVAKARSLRDRPSIAGWLYLTTRFEAAHAVRTERRRQAREVEAQTMHDILLNPEPSVDWNRLRSVIDEILPALNERDRELVLLRFFQGLSFPDIGARVGLTADAVRFRLDRALEKIRFGLAKRGVHSTAEALALALAGQAEAAAPSGLALAVIGTVLASARTTGAGATGLLQFMSTSKMVIGAGLLAGLLGIGFSVHENAVGREAVAALVAANHQYDTSFAQLQELRKQAQQAKEEFAALQSVAAAQSASSSKRGIGADAEIARQAAAPVAVRSGPPTINRELSNNPEVREALTGWMNGADNVIYGALFKSLGLSAADIQSLENLMLQGDINMSSAWLTLRPEGVTTAQVEQSIHALLGDANYQQFNQYESTQYVREVASGLAGNLYDTDTPLTSQQAEQLTQILAQNSSLPPKSGPPFPGTIAWDGALKQAQGILSAPQLAVLQNEATILSIQPGLWGGLNPISPGSIGNTPAPPSAFYAAPGSLK